MSDNGEQFEKSPYRNLLLLVIITVSVIIIISAGMLRNAQVRLDEQKKENEEKEKGLFPIILLISGILGVTFCCFLFFYGERKNILEEANKAKKNYSSYTGELGESVYF